jgi:cell division protein FtsX
VYNGSVASALGTPQLTPQSLAGFEFELQLGRSMMLGTRGGEVGTERAQVVGVSPYAMRFGVTVPMATGKRLLERYGEPGAAPVFRGLLVRARTPADVPAVVAAAKGMGLGIDETARRTADMLSAATAVASLVGFLVLLLAGLNIAHSFFASVSERRRELAILRALGAKRGHLVALVLSEAAWLGLAGGFLGGVGGFLGARLIDVMAAMLLPAFPFRPDSFFSLPWWIFALGLGAAVAAALLGALGPALAAARASVSRSLAEG